MRSSAPQPRASHLITVVALLTLLGVGAAPWPAAASGSEASSSTTSPSPSFRQRMDVHEHTADGHATSGGAEDHSGHAGGDDTTETETHATAGPGSDGHDDGSGGHEGSPGAGSGGEHGDAGHGQAGGPVDRPRALVLGSFGVFNGLVLLGAAVVRLRGGGARRARARAARGRAVASPSL